ncbi:MAG: ABC transporter ATP-binding protein [Deltaproteobacteria bacterium]|jgi:energy-coupling factor transport system ATP-binding protein|nr:ABC transporter ATP-binding protein [Deltaproteobacteria bacterium]
MLEAKGLGYRYPGARRPALSGVGFELEEGEGLLVAGESGGGKSTLLLLLAGLCPRFLKGDMQGEILLEGKPMAGFPEWAARTGLMTQNPESQFLAGSVEDELYLTLRCRGISGPEARAAAEGRLRAFGIEHVRLSPVLSLSEGQKQRAVLAALTALRPRALLLDEPSANLDPRALEDLAGLLQALAAEGVSIVVADHRLYWLKGVCSKVLVLAGGEPAAYGGWEVLSDARERVRLGLRGCERPERPALPDAGGSAEGPGGDTGGAGIERLCFRYPGGPTVLDGFSAFLPSGKACALSGPSGRGKTTLGRLLCGLERPLSGKVLFNGVPAGPDLGQAVLQNSDHQLFMPRAIDEVATALGGGRRRAEAEAMRILESYGLGELAARHPQSLSGGEKQRLVTAAALARPSRLAVLDEPTSGLDGRNLLLMARQIKALADSGPAVLVVTHDEELVALVGDLSLDLGPWPETARGH